MEPRRRRLQDWHHMLAMCLVMAIIAGGLAYIFLHIDLIPNPASEERGLIDSFIQVLFAIASGFFAIIVTVFGYALLFFRRQPGDESDARPIRGKIPLELSWTIIPLIIVIVLSVYGAKVLDDMTATNPNYSTVQSIFSLGVFVPSETPASGNTSQEQDLVVDVTASRYVWEFAYPDYSINSTYVLEVPVNRRMVLNIHSKDVIHSFWVQQWGPKQDAVPGLSPVLRITPTKIGQYTIQCSQLCGFGHTDMTAPVRVVSADDFDKWVQQQQSSSANTSSSPPADSHVMIELVAQNIAFDKSTITVPAGVEVMINFDNKDNGVPHNFAVYKTSAAQDKIFSGQIITGPKRITYTFTAPETKGNYFFRCDVHPTLMTGMFIVK
jgi:cytochrome c oxidase subunit 2